MNVRDIAAVSVAFSLAAAAHATTMITFEELPNGLTAMVNTPGAAVPTDSQLTNQYLASNGVSFTSLAGYAALVNHGLGNPTASVPNIIGGTTANGALDYNAPITISFFDVNNNSVVAVIDTFKIQGDWFPLGSGHVFATAYGAAGNVLASTSDTDDKVFGVSGPVLQFSITGIHSVVISGDNGTVGFDQMEYGALTTVPEPGTWALLATGLAFVGGTTRRRAPAANGGAARRRLVAGSRSCPHEGRTTCCADVIPVCRRYLRLSD
jgi:hypothetical protein